MVGPFDSETEFINAKKYMKTKFFRILVAIHKISQDAASKVYSCVPLQDFNEEWTDEKLYKKYNLTQEEIEFIQGWQNRVTHVKDFAGTVLPEERELPFQLGVEMDVDQNGNVIYYYDMDDYRYMDSKSFKRNFPKILQQTIHQVGQPTGGAANVSRPEGCAGTSHVSGYVRSDGVKVSDYERTCGAKHLGEQKASEKYRGLKVEQMTKDELDELLDELI